MWRVFFRTFLWVDIEAEMKCKFFNIVIFSALPTVTTPAAGRSRWRTPSGMRAWSSRTSSRSRRRSHSWRSRPPSERRTHRRLSYLRNAHIVITAEEGRFTVQSSPAASIPPFLLELLWQWVIRGWGRWLWRSGEASHYERSHSPSFRNERWHWRENNQIAFPLFILMIKLSVYMSHSRGLNSTNWKYIYKNPVTAASPLGRAAAHGCPHLGERDQATERVRQARHGRYSAKVPWAGELQFIRLRGLREWAALETDPLFPRRRSDPVKSPARVTPSS